MKLSIYHHSICLLVMRIFYARFIFSDFFTTTPKIQMIRSDTDLFLSNRSVKPLRYRKRDILSSLSLPWSILWEVIDLLQGSLSKLSKFQLLWINAFSKYIRYLAQAKGMLKNIHVCVKIVSELEDRCCHLYQILILRLSTKDLLELLSLFN